jgi:hypothetical protein
MVTAKARQLPEEISDRRVAGAWDLPERVPSLTRKIRDCKKIKCTL